MNFPQKAELKKLKPWGPFWSYRLNSTANLAHYFPVLFSICIVPKWAQDFDFFNYQGCWIFIWAEFHWVSWKFSKEIGLNSTSKFIWPKWFFKRQNWELKKYVMGHPLHAKNSIVSLSFFFHLAWSSRWRSRTSCNTSFYFLGIQIIE